MRQLSRAPARGRTTDQDRRSRHTSTQCARAVRSWPTEDLKPELVGWFGRDCSHYRRGIVDRGSHIAPNVCTELELNDRCRPPLANSDYGMAAKDDPSGSSGTDGPWLLAEGSSSVRAPFTTVGPFVSVTSRNFWRFTRPLDRAHRQEAPSDHPPCARQRRRRAFALARSRARRPAPTRCSCTPPARSGATVLVITGGVGAVPRLAGATRRCSTTAGASSPSRSGSPRPTSSASRAVLVGTVSVALVAMAIAFPLALIDGALHQRVRAGLDQVDPGLAGRPDGRGALDHLGPVGLLPDHAARRGARPLAAEATSAGSRSSTSTPTRTPPCGTPAATPPARSAPASRCR